MTAYKPEDHPRGGDGQFRAKIAREQEGSLDGDSAPAAGAVPGGLPAPAQLKDLVSGEFGVKTNVSPVGYGTYKVSVSAAAWRRKGPMVSETGHRLAESLSEAAGHPLHLSAYQEKGNRFDAVFTTDGAAERWNPLPADALGEHGTPDPASGDKLREITSRLRGQGSLNEAEARRMDTAAQAVSDGDYATAADELAQAASSAATRGDEAAAQACVDLFYRVNGRRNNQDTVAYWESREHGTFTRVIRDPETLDRVLNALPDVGP